MTAPFFYHVGDIRSRHHIAATQADRSAKHELACERIAKRAPRLRRYEGRWQTRTLDGRWANV
jgi:hypothetical protein